MHTYTTCTTCHELLDVTLTETHHPHCAPTGIAADTARFVELASREHLGDDEAHQLDVLRDRLDGWDRRPLSPLRAALAYAAWGWAVFPCATGGKTPLTRHGLHDATTDLATIHAWWQRYPHANIGLPAGHAFDVLDIDPDGTPWYLRALLDDQLPDVHGEVATPRGRHLYLTPRGGGNLAALHPGVDYRGRGGYVIAPPSVVDGQRYTWTTHPSPLITDTSKPGVDHTTPATPGGGS